MPISVSTIPSQVTQFTAAEAITAVEGEATLVLAGDVTIAAGKALSVDTISEITAGAGVTTDGLLTKDGSLTPAAGKGVDFAAQSSPSAGMASELLDHYEEGTFTPGISDSSADAQGDDKSQAYHASTVGQYTRIGRQVSVYGYVVLTSTGSMTATDGVNLVGLPFTSLAGGSLNPSFHLGRMNNAAIDQYAHVSGMMAAGTAYVQMSEWNTAAGISSFQIQELSANGSFYFSGIYYV
jgi:hypothetical protein